MDGLYGQFGIIAPDLGACITLTGHYEGSTGDILRAVWTELIPALPTRCADRAPSSSARPIRE